MPQPKRGSMKSMRMSAIWSRCSATDRRWTASSRPTAASMGGARTGAGSGSTGARHDGQRAGGLGAQRSDLARRGGARHAGHRLGAGRPLQVDLDAVEALEVARDGQFRGDHRLDARAEREGHVVDDEHVLRRGHGDHDALDARARRHQGDGHVAGREVGLEHGDDRRIRLVEVALQGRGHAQSGGRALRKPDRYRADRARTICVPMPAADQIATVENEPGAARCEQSELNEDFAESHGQGRTPRRRHGDCRRSRAQETSAPSHGVQGRMKSDASQAYRAAGRFPGGRTLAALGGGACSRPTARRAGGHCSPTRAATPPRPAD